MVHVRFRFDALAGSTLALNVLAFPALIVVVALLKLTLVTGFPCTVTLAVAVLPPQFVLTLTVAVPTPTAVTTPRLFTLTTAPLLVSHVTPRFVALLGVIVALSVILLPRLIVNAV